MNEWKPIDSAPDDGTLHARGVWINSYNQLAWMVDCGYINDEGCWVDSIGDQTHGWEAEEYTHWTEMPSEPPEHDGPSK